MRMTSRIMRSKRRVRAKNADRTPRSRSVTGQKTYPASVTTPQAIRTPEPKNLLRCKHRMTFASESEVSEVSASENEFDLDDDTSECDFQSRLRKLGFGEENFTPFATPMHNKKKRRKKKEPVEVEEGGVITETAALLSEDRCPSVHSVHFAANPGPDRQKTTIIENYAKDHLVSESEDANFYEPGQRTVNDSTTNSNCITLPPIDVGQDPFEFGSASPRQYKALFSEPRIILNVGGTRFETLEQTIRKASFLRGLLLFGKQTGTKQGEFFIDRDPTLFAPLLHFLRSSSLCIPQGICRRAIADEAIYYGIPLPPKTEAQYTIIKEYISPGADPTIVINPSNPRIKRVEVKINKSSSSKICVGDSVLYKNHRSFKKGTVAKKRSAPEGEKILIQSNSDSEGRWIDATLVAKTPPKAFGLKIGEVIYTSRTSTLHAVLEELASQGFELKTSPLLENNIREYILYRK